jgi:hypothetical protein
VESATGIVSHRVDDVGAAFGATQLLTPRQKPRDVEQCDSGTVTQTAFTSELVFCSLDAAEINVAPSLRIWTGVHPSGQQKRTKPNQPQDEW